MKKITTLALVLACLLAVTGMAHAEPAGATPDQSSEISCASVVGEDGQIVTQSSNSCGTCGPAPACDGKAFGAWCWEAGQGWGTCDIYLGFQCTDGSGWDCNCYQSGEYIP